MAKFFKSLACKTKRHAIALSLSFIVVGLIYIFGPILYFAILKHEGSSDNKAYWQHNAVAAQAKAPPKMDLATPIELYIPRLNIKLNVAAGAYNAQNQAWLLDRTHAFFIAPGQAPLNSSATALIYGHNIPGVFRTLDGVALGEPMLITNNKGKTLLFKYVGDRILSPNQGVSLNDHQPNDDLTLLTCTSVYFTNRQLYFFKYMGDQTPQLGAASGSVKI